MLCCVRCGQTQSGGTLCSACGAVLPRKAPELAVPSFSLEEGRDYVQPEVSYDMENLVQLRYAVEDFLDGAEAAEVQAWLTYIRAGLQTFRTRAVPDLMHLLDYERTLDPDNDFPHQVSYLVQKGLALFDEALDDLATALEAEDETALEAGLVRLQQGNDNLVLSMQMVAQRQREIETALQDAE